MLIFTRRWLANGAGNDATQTLWTIITWQYKTRLVFFWVKEALNAAFFLLKSCSWIKNWNFWNFSFFCLFFCLNLYEIFFVRSIIITELKSLEKNVKHSLLLMTWKILPIFEKCFDRYLLFQILQDGKIFEQIKDLYLHLKWNCVFTFITFLIFLSLYLLRYIYLAVIRLKKIQYAFIENRYVVVVWRFIKKRMQE